MTFSRWWREVENFLQVYLLRAVPGLHDEINHSAFGVGRPRYLCVSNVVVAMMRSGYGKHHMYSIYIGIVINSRQTTNHDMCV